MQTPTFPLISEQAPSALSSSGRHYRYLVIKQHITSEELGTYVTYGIRVERDQETLALIHDLSTKFEDIQRLADLCTKHQLSFEHLSDVIEDFLADPSLTLKE